MLLEPGCAVIVQLRRDEKLKLAGRGVLEQPLALHDLSFTAARNLERTSYSACRSRCSEMPDRSASSACGVSGCDSASSNSARARGGQPSSARSTWPTSWR